MFIEELFKFLNYLEDLPLYKISNTLGYCFTYGISGCVVSIKNRDFDELRILVQNDKISIYLAYYDKLHSNWKVKTIMDMPKSDIMNYDNLLLFILSHGRISSKIDEIALENLVTINSKLEKVSNIHE